MNAPIIRPGRDDDAAGFFALIGGCWAEYPGCVMVPDEVPELTRLASWCAEHGGAVWAAERDGQVVGVISATPLAEPGAWEIKKLYVQRDQRGTGLAHRLLDTAEAHARAAGAARLLLWSDTRFDAAHAFYEKRSFLRAGAIRVLNDASHSLEFPYAKPLTGLAVAELDAAAAASAMRRLEALGHAGWRGLATAVATGGAALLAGWVEGDLAGAAALRLGAAPEARHRAALEVLLVAPPARRRGLGRRLLQAAEHSATRPGRTLLTADCPAAGPAAALLVQAGWHEAGRIPAHRVIDGKPEATAFFYRALT